MTPAEIALVTYVQAQQVQWSPGDNVVVSPRPGRTFLGIFGQGIPNSVFLFIDSSFPTAPGIPPTFSGGWLMTHHDWGGILSHEWHVFIGAPLTVYILEGWIG